MWEELAGRTADPSASKKENNGRTLVRRLMTLRIKDMQFEIGIPNRLLNPALVRIEALDLQGVCGQR